MGVYRSLIIATGSVSCLQVVGAHNFAMGLRPDSIGRRKRDMRARGERAKRERSEN